MIGLPRRSFLKAFGALPLAPAAAKEAMTQAGVSGVGLGSAVQGMGFEPSMQNMPSPIGYDDGQKAANWLLMNGVPDFNVQAMRAEHRIPQGLDPDLASNRSFSLTTKVRLQRERDVQRRCADLVDRQRLTLKKAALRKVAGVDFWW